MFRRTPLFFFLFCALSSAAQPGFTKIRSTPFGDPKNKYDLYSFQYRPWTKEGTETMLDSFRLAKRVLTFHTTRWRNTSRDSAGFVGTVTRLDDSTYLVRDYFISGEPQMTGVYISHDSVNWKRRGTAGWDSTFHPKRSGKWVWWNRSGMINRIRDYGSDAEYPYESFDFIDPVIYLQVPDSVTVRNSGSYRFEKLWEQKRSDKVQIDEDLYENNGTFISTGYNKLKFHTGRFMLVVSGKKGDKVSVKRCKPGGGVRSQYSSRSERMTTLSYPCSFGAVEIMPIASVNCSMNYSLLINRIDAEDDFWLSGFSKAELFIIDRNSDQQDEIYLLGYRCDAKSQGWTLIRITSQNRF